MAEISPNSPLSWHSRMLEAHGTIWEALIRASPEPSAGYCLYSEETISFRRSSIVDWHSGLLLGFSKNHSLERIMLSLKRVRSRQGLEGMADSLRVDLAHAEAICPKG